MERVLQIVESMHQGGIQTFIMNVYREMDRTRCQFDFLVFRNDKQLYEEEILALGGKIYKCASRRQGLLTCLRDLEKFFKTHNEYQVVHYHASSLSFIEPLYVAHKFGVKTRIIHSHSSSFLGNKVHVLLHYMNRQRIGKLANTYLACGSPAQKWMFGNINKMKDVHILYNGINVEQFAFDSKIRMETRSKLGIQNKLVIGHVGRFSKVKNQSFLVDVFIEVLKKETDAVLLLIGDGEQKREIENKCNLCGITEQVLFLGNRNDVQKYLMAMDVFIMPSLYEGFPVTMIEAETVGIPILLSDSVTNEAVINSNVEQVSLNKSAEDWAKKAINIAGIGRVEPHMKGSNYDIQYVVDELLGIYET